MPPLAFLMNDPGRRETWSKWDIKLVHAYHLNKVFEIDGYPIHIEESPDISWSVKRKKLRSAAAVEAEQEKMSKGNAKNYGVRIVAVPKLREGAKWPRRADWAMKNSGVEEPNDKMANLRVAAEERARLKIEGSVPLNVDT
jgi:hypothetical protein